MFVSPLRRLHRSPSHTRKSCRTTRSCTSCLNRSCCCHGGAPNPRCHRTNRSSGHRSRRNRSGIGRPPWMNAIPRPRSGRSPPRPPHMPVPPRELSLPHPPTRRCFHNHHHRRHRRILPRNRFRTNSRRSPHHRHPRLRCRLRPSRPDAGGGPCPFQSCCRRPSSRRAPLRSRRSQSPQWS